MVCIGTGAATSQQAVAAGPGDGRHVGDRLGHGPPSGCTRTRRATGVDAVADLLGARARGETTASWWRWGSAGWITTTSTRRATRNARPSPRRSRWRTRTTSRLVIHARDAWSDLFDVLHAEGVPERTVLHCFTGGPDEVEQCLRGGMYVSFSGIVTFKNAADVREAAARCPLDRLLVETDSPFLAPVPHRGRTNEPSYLPFVGDAVAAVKGCTVDEVRERSAAAAAMVFSTGS